MKFNITMKVSRTYTHNEIKPSTVMQPSRFVKTVFKFSSSHGLTGQILNKSCNRNEQNITYSKSTVVATIFNALYQTKKQKLKGAKVMMSKTLVITAIQRQSMFFSFRRFRTERSKDTKLWSGSGANSNFQD